MKKLLVIKLGGSVITYKDNPLPKARHSVIKRLAAEIKQIDNLKKYQIILVHGAGSFAHSLVKKHDLHHGMKTDQQKLAFSLVTDRMLQLNSIVMNYLFKAKLASVSIVPHTFIVQSAGKLNYIDLEIIKKHLNEDQIPVLFGDLVLDHEWGCSVLSGDTIVPYIAKNLKASQVIYLSDVDGIFDVDPKKNLNAKLIPEITNKNLGGVLKGLSPTGRADVTGEMKGKVLNIKQHLASIPVLLLNGLKPELLLKALESNLVGTRVFLN